LIAVTNAEKNIFCTFTFPKNKRFLVNGELVIDGQLDTAQLARLHALKKKKTRTPALRAAASRGPSRQGKKKRGRARAAGSPSVVHAGPNTTTPQIFPIQKGARFAGPWPWATFTSGLAHSTAAETAQQCY